MRQAWSDFIIACVVAHTWLGSASAATPVDPQVTQLIDLSGFDALIRRDTESDSALLAYAPEFLDGELRADMAAALARTLSYADTRRAMAEQLASRVQALELDPHLRWWASSTGKAIAAAHMAASRHAMEESRSPLIRAPNPTAQKLLRESPFIKRFREITDYDSAARHCLQAIVSLRRICTAAQATHAAGSEPGGDHPASDLVLTEYSRLSTADIEAFRSYLQTPGAAQLIDQIADSYVRTRESRVHAAQRAIDDALARFGRKTIGKDVESTLREVTAIVDEGRALDEARLVLHLLRGVAPRDPRIYVQLTRVALKQAPLTTPYHPIGSPPAVETEHLDDAQSWMDRAMGLDAKRADTLVLAGHLAFLKYEFARSVQLLEQARAVGTNNIWLRPNLADALWAMGKEKGDRELLAQAARELETALQQGLPTEIQWQARYSLAHIHGDRGDIAKARGEFQRLIASSQGRERVEALQAQAFFLFMVAKDVDAAILAGRQVQRLSGGRDTLLGRALLVQAAKLFDGGRAADAKRLVQEAQEVWPGVEHEYALLARMPLTFRAVIALHEAGVVRDLSDAQGGTALLHASTHASGKDIERLIEWRADPNYLDAGEGTPLYRAIVGRNLPAIRVLLARGADVSIRDPEGRLPVEFAELAVEASEPNGPEILAALRQASRKNAAAVSAGGPLREGYVYEALKRIAGGRYGYDLEIGTRVTFLGFCRYTNENLACLNFRHPTQPSNMDVALEKVQLVSWRDWFKEIGPAPGK